MDASMHEFLGRLARGEADADEVAWLEAWRTADPGRVAEIDEVLAVLDVAAAAERHVVPGGPPRAEELVARAHALHLRATGSESRRQRRLLPFVATAAASAVLAVMGVRAIEGLLRAPDRVGVAAEEFVTGPGQSSTVRLSDGTVVHLGPESRLQLMPGESVRQVTLEGRAFFAVTSDSARPFRVITAGGSARVLGTRFQLDSDPWGVRLIVLEGEVALGGPSEEVSVRAGQMMRRTSAGETGPIVPAPGLEALADGWLGQFLIFRDTPLHRAAAEIAQIYDVDVHITDPDLGMRTLTMWMSERTLEEVLTVVCSAVDARCRMDGGGVTIAPRDEATATATPLEEAGA